MSSTVRLGKDGGFEHERAGSFLPQGLIIAPWFDRQNRDMPYIFTLLPVEDNETFVLSHPAGYRKPMETMGNFSRRYNLMLDTENTVFSAPKKNLRVNIFAAVIDLPKGDEIFDLFDPLRRSVLVTEGRDDPNCLVAVRVKRILQEKKYIKKYAKPEETGDFVPEGWPPPDLS